MHDKRWGRGLAGPVKMMDKVRREGRCQGGSPSPAATDQNLRIFWLGFDKNRIEFINTFIANLLTF
jgi:hypothetical protein